MQAVFLDRDGVINRYPGDADYVKSLAEFHFLPGAKSALKRLIEAGFKLFIISNQAGVSKGVYPKEQLDLITANMLAELKIGGVEITGVHYCIHRPEDNCPCRKPKAGLIDNATRDAAALGEKIDLAQSFFIGDTTKDVEAGRAAGVTTIMVFSGKEKPRNKNNWPVQPDFTAIDLSAAVDLILVGRA